MSSKIRMVFVSACGLLCLVKAVGVRPASTATTRGQVVTEPARHSERFDDNDFSSLSTRLRAAATIMREEIAGRGAWYRDVELQNMNSGQTATFRITPDGIVSPQDEAALTRFFRCRRTRRRHRIDPGVLSMLVDLSSAFKGKTIEVVSGFRASPYGVKHSKHFVGRAIDLRVRGVRLTTVRNYLWTNHSQTGVGYYPHHGFVHLDYRPDTADTAWTSARGRRNYRKNPRWARRARAAASESNSVQIAGITIAKTM